MRRQKTQLARGICADAAAADPEDDVFTGGRLGSAEPASRGCRMNKATFFLGLTGLAVGALPILALTGVLPTGAPPRDPAPAWIGILIGLMFASAGLLAIIRSFAGMDAGGNLAADAPGAVKAVNFGLGFVVAAGLASVFTWVAFGPGERHFTVSAGGFSGPAGSGGDILGRVMFGAGAVLGWIIVILTATPIARRWMGQRPER